jgi:hypothetical protein
MSLSSFVKPGLRFLHLILLLGASVVACAADKAPKQGAVDTRYNLRLIPTEQAEFLAEMRSMLASIQYIAIGIGASDRAMIAEYALRSGNTMARATPASVRAKTPPSFQAIGGPTHLLFEELAIRAESDDMDMIATDTGKLMNQCAACHAAFKVR